MNPKKKRKDKKKMMEKKKKVLLVMLCTICFLQPAIAQRFTRQYNNVSFSAVLKDLNAAQDKYAINFVYDELEDFKVSKSIRNLSVPDAIQQLIGFYPIKMTQMDNVLIVPNYLPCQEAMEATWCLDEVICQ